MIVRWWSQETAWAAKDMAWLCSTAAPTEISSRRSEHFLSVYMCNMITKNDTSRQTSWRIDTIVSIIASQYQAPKLRKHHSAWQWWIVSPFLSSSVLSLIYITFISLADAVLPENRWIVLIHQLLLFVAFIFIPTHPFFSPLALKHLTLQPFICLTIICIHIFSSYRRSAHILISFREVSSSAINNAHIRNIKALKCIFMKDPLQSPAGLLWGIRIKHILN